MPAKKKRARGTGETRAIGFEVPADLDDALEDCAREEQRLKRIVLTRALEKYLTEGGFWPRARGTKESPKKNGPKSKET